MRVRPKTKHVKKVNSRRCQKCGGKLNSQVVRCRRCSEKNPRPTKR